MKNTIELLKASLNTELVDLWKMYKNKGLPEGMIGDFDCLHSFQDGICKHCGETKDSAPKTAEELYQRLFDFESNEYESVMFTIGNIYGLKEAVKLVDKRVSK